MITNLGKPGILSRYIITWEKENYPERPSGGAVSSSDHGGLMAAKRTDGRVGHSTVQEPIEVERRHPRCHAGAMPGIPRGE